MMTLKTVGVPPYPRVGVQAWVLGRSSLGLGAE